MANEGDILVQISAKIDELQRGLAEAVAEVRSATSKIQDETKKTGEAGKEMSGHLKAALAGGEFLVFEQIARKALRAVQVAFEDTAGAAIEFGVANDKFARQLGISLEEAAGLAGALNDVGSSTAEYSATALRLTMQVNNNEKGMNAMGIATRNADGALMNSKQLMDSAIATYKTYKEGADQNAFATEVFGRGAGRLTEILRVNQQAVEDETKAMKDMGVITGQEAGDAAKQLQVDMADLSDMFSNAGIAIGQALLPALHDLIGVLSDVLKPTLAIIVLAFKEVIIIIDAVVTAAYLLGTSIGTVISEMIVTLVGFGKVAYQVFTLDFGGAAATLESTVKQMESVWNKSMASMSSTAEGFLNRAKGIISGNNLEGMRGSQDPETGGGKKSFVPPPPKGAGTADKTRQLNDEILRGDMQRAMEEIKIEEQKYASLYALGQTTNEEFVEQQKSLEEKKFAITKSYLEKRMQVDKKDAVALQRDKDQMLLVEMQHAAAIQRIDQDAAKQAQQRRQQDTQDFIQDNQERLASEIEELNEGVTEHKITVKEKIKAEMELTAAIYKQNIMRLDGEIKELKVGTDAWRKAMKDREKLVNQFNKSMSKSNHQMVQEQQKGWNQLGSSMKSSFGSALSGMLTGTKTWRQAVGEILDSLVNSFVDMAMDMLSEWISTEFEKMFVTKATATTSALSQITASAAAAGAGAYAATALIPYVGPILAPGAAATAYAGAMSFAGMAMAEKGMMLDEDQLVYAHKKEMILPAHLSSGLQNMINGSSTTNNQSGGLTYSPTINAPGNPSLEQLLQKESAYMLKWMKARERDGAIGSKTKGKR